MPIRAIRGATTLDSDSAEQTIERVGELFDRICEANHVTSDEIVSILLTSTPDLHSIYPAEALRRARGLKDVPLIGSQEIDVPTGLARTVRIMATVESKLSKSDVTHVFLHGAAGLRPDLDK